MKTKNQPTLLRLLMAALFSGVCICAGADTFYVTVNGAELKYTTVDNQYADVNGFVAKSDFTGALKIPATVTYNGTTYNTYRVDDFEECNNITSLEIEGCWSIGASAFYKCTNITSVIVRSMNKRKGHYSDGIHGHAFYNCTSLTYVEIPARGTGGDMLYAFDGDAFNGCTNLQNITVSNNGNSDLSQVNHYYTTDGVLYSYTHNNQTRELVCYPNGKTTKSFNLPSDVTSVGEEAFTNNTNLESVRFGIHVESVGDGCFENCTNLKTVSLPNALSSLGSSAFSRCWNLKSINIPDSLKEIAPYTFYGCTNLQSITLPNTIETIGIWAFSSSGLSSVKLPYYLKEIEGGAFADCPNLTSVTAKNPVAPTCDDNAFKNIESKIKLVVPVGSNYAQLDPWKRMKSITETDDVLEKYGIRVLGIEVTELNYKDILNDGGRMKYETYGMLTLKNLDLSTATSDIKFVDNYGVDDLYINIVGNCSVTTTNGYPFYLEGKTFFMGDTLTVSGKYGIVSYRAVDISNNVFVLEATNQMFFSNNLTIWGNTGFIGSLGASAKMGHIGNLTLGMGCDIVAFEQGHSLAYDSEEGTILDNGEDVAGGTNFSVGVSFPMYYCGIHLTSATNYLTKGLLDLFQVTPDAYGGYILEGVLWGIANDMPVLRTYAAGLELQLTGYSYVSSSGSGIPAISIDGNATFGGTGQLVVKSDDGAGIWIRQGWLRVQDIDLSVEGKTAGVEGLVKYGTQYWGTLKLNNVAGTISARDAGAPAIKTVKALTLEDCYIAGNAAFDETTHNVDAQEIELVRTGIVTDIDDAPHLNDNGQGINDKDAAVYDLQGRRVDTPQSGHIYIIRMADGTTRKVMIR